jgi:hypothetical protein
MRVAERDGEKLERPMSCQAVDCDGLMTMMNSNVQEETFYLTEKHIYIVTLLGFLSNFYNYFI